MRMKKLKPGRPLDKYITSSRASEETDEGFYFPISPFMIFPEAYGEFAVFVRKGKNYILFTRQGEQFNEAHKNALHENGTKEVYIHLSQKQNYDRYLEENLEKTLLDESIPLPVRGNVFYYLSTSILNELFERNESSLDSWSFDKLKNVVRSSLGFLSMSGSLRALSQIMSRYYGTHTHCTNVFIYTAALLSKYNLPGPEKVDIGLGAILHDIGKSAISKRILNKRGKLNLEERALLKKHPVQGTGMCALVSIGQTVVNGILFHHEKMDGSGYPAGLAESAIPLAARVTGVADSFDMLTSERPFLDPVSPHVALNVIAEQMNGRYDPDVVERFVAVLSGAGIL